MKNASWAVYVTALLIGSSLAIVSDASAPELDWMPGSLGCNFETCPACVMDGCNQGPGEHLYLTNTLTSLRCVEYDHIPPPHCAEFYVAFYEVHDSAHAVLRTCVQIPCGLGEPTAEECTDPWILPDPE